MPFRPMRKSQSANSLLMLSIGAAAGLVVGAIAVDRLGGLDRVLPRRGRKDEESGGGDEPTEPYGLHDADGGYDDEDDELSPESIAHVHVGSRQRSARQRSASHTSPDVLTLEARVLEAFHNDPVLRERAIDIGAIAEGVIELTGWVHADSEVAHAVTIAGGVPDVQHVIDQLSVRQPVRSRRATDPRPHLPVSDPMTSAPPQRAD